MIKLHFPLSLLLLIPTITWASTFSSKGEIELGFRQLQSDHNKETLDHNFSVKSTLELDHENNFFKSHFRGFSRVDAKNKERNIFNLEELYIQKEIASEEIEYSLTAGNQLFSWSIQEIFHPVDTLHSRNYNSRISSLDKFGETAITIDAYVNEFELKLLFFPLFKSPQYPDSRSRPGLGISIADPVIVKSSVSKDANELLPQFGLKLSNSFQNSELSLFSLYHIDRDSPVIGTRNFQNILGINVPLEIPNTPFFHYALKTGLTYQYNFSHFIYKFEALSTTYLDHPEILTVSGIKTATNNQLYSTGVEKPFSFDSGIDMTVYLEYQRSSQTQGSLLFFQNDIGLASTITLNDIQGTEFTTLLIHDISSNKETLINLGLSRRINDFWKYKINTQIILVKKEGTATGLEIFDKNNEINATITRFF
jgi:hypothetical protein